MFTDVVDKAVKTAPRNGSKNKGKLERFCVVALLKKMRENNFIRRFDLNFVNALA